MSNLINVSEVSAFERYSSQFGLSAGDAEWLARLSSRLTPFKSGDHVAEQGQQGSNIHLLHHGWAYSAIEHKDGSRTILDLHLPGDFIISPGILSTPRRTTLCALSDCSLSELNIEEITSHTVQSESANKLLLHLLGMHHESAANRVVQTTRMPALTRLAAFYLDLLERLQAIAPAVTTSFYNPATNAVVAELLGMTAVHASRTHSKLRELGVLTIERRVVNIHNLAKLRELSVLDDSYRSAA